MEIVAFIQKLRFPGEAKKKKERFDPGLERRLRIRSGPENRKQKGEKNREGGKEEVKKGPMPTVKVV